MSSKSIPFFYVLASAEINKLILTLNILTALKGWVGHAPQGRGALHIIILKLNDYII